MPAGAATVARDRRQRVRRKVGNGLQTAPKRGRELAHAALERGAEWAEVARERAPEVAGSRPERAGELADTARTQAKERRSRRRCPNGVCAPITGLLGSARVKPLATTHVSGTFAE